jgi:hypothetical protein
VERLRAFVNADAWIVDVGANIGFFTVVFARCDVASVEAQDDLLQHGRCHSTMATGHVQLSLAGERGLDRRQVRQHPGRAKRGGDAGEIAPHGIVGLAFRHGGKCPAPRDKQVGPGQRLGARIVFKQRGGTPSPCRITRPEHRLDRIAMEPEMAVADAAAAQYLFALRQELRTLGRVRHRTAEHPKDQRSGELHTDLATDRQCRA